MKLAEAAEVLSPRAAPEYRVIRMFFVIACDIFGVVPKKVSVVLSN